MNHKELAAALVARGLDVSAALVLQWPTELASEVREWVAGNRKTVPDVLYAFDYQDRLPKQEAKPAKVTSKQRTMF